MDEPSSKVEIAVAIALAIPCLALTAECLDIADHHLLRIAAIAGYAAIPGGVALFFMAKKRTIILWACFAVYMVAVFSIARFSMT
jgi:hypothetical protein